MKRNRLIHLQNAHGKKLGKAIYRKRHAMEISQNELLSYLRAFRNDAELAFKLIPHAAYSLMISKGWINLRNEILPEGLAAMEG